MDEITRVIKEFLWLLQYMNIAKEDCEIEIEESVEAIKHELGSWFIDDDSLFVGS